MDAPRPARLRVGVVGAGRVGATLGAALARSGHEIIAASGISQRSRSLAERLLPGVAVLPVDEVVAAAELVLVAIPDDALRPLVAGLADTGAWRAGQLVAHTSGAHGVGVLDPAAARGVVPLALHPVMTFTGRPEDLDRLSGVPFGITAADPMRPVAESLVLEMGGEPVWVPEPARALYHAALSIASNHLVTLVNDAMSLLGGAGVGEPARLLAPLLSASLDNVLRLGDAALTGPVSRGDADTVRRHLTTLRESGESGEPDESGGVAAAYVALARRTADRAAASGLLRADQRADIENALS